MHPRRLCCSARSCSDTSSNSSPHHPRILIPSVPQSPVENGRVPRVCSNSALASTDRFALYFGKPIICTYPDAPSHHVKHKPVYITSYRSQYTRNKVRRQNGNGPSMLRFPFLDFLILTNRFAAKAMHFLIISLTIC